MQLTYMRDRKSGEGIPDNLPDEPLSRKGKPWTREEEAKIVRWAKDQSSVHDAWESMGELADALGRSVSAVQGRMELLAADYERFAKALQAIRAKAREPLGST